MLATETRLIIFTDLDGCLLNKHDYDWSNAADALSELRQRNIPVIMNSSKTVMEMTQLADELGFKDSTFVSENGSVIRWGCDVGPHCETEIVGLPRDAILHVLRDQKRQFRFRSFADLQLSGVIEQTQLSAAKAQQALERLGTEPLLWDDSEQNRLAFATELKFRELTLTKGGRFWHVAGQTSKGSAMQIVAARLSLPETNTKTVAIGDSPIDQSMLDLADFPIGIPTSTGLGVTIAASNGIVPTKLGAAGWAEAIELLLSRLDQQPLTS